MVSQKVKIEVYGLVTDPKFHQAKVTAEGAHQKKPDVVDVPLLKSMLEHEWLAFIDDFKKASGGSITSYSETTITKVNNGEFLGKTDDFIEFCANKFDFKDFRPVPLFQAMSRMAYEEQLTGRAVKNDFVYMDIQIGKDQSGRLLIELFSDMVPRTCHNFKQLCVGDKQESSKHDPPLHLSYKESIFHRVVKNGWVQGGDIINGSGKNGWSVHGETFEDESYSVLHSKRGIIGMANKGRHTNASQFYITFQPAPWMDCQYVAFGQVIEGLDTLDKMEAIETYNERPVTECRISECRVVDVKTWMELM